MGWILLRYRIKKNLDLACTRFRIHSVLKNFYFGKRIQKVANSNAGYTGHPTEHLPVRSLRVDGSRIRKEKVADSKISWYVWMGSKLRLANKNCTINIKLKKCSLFLAMRGAKPRSKWVYNLVAHEARVMHGPRVDPSELQTRSAHLYLYISDGVRHDVIQ